MKPMSVRLLFMLTVLALARESQARAETINYSYDWVAQPAAVIAGNGMKNTASVTFLVPVDGTQQFTIGSAPPSLIPVATVTTFSTATGTPDSFTNVPFALKLTLTDAAFPGQSGVLTFNGLLNGTLTSNSQNLTGDFTANQVTQTTTLGNHQYTVVIDPAHINLPSPTDPEKQIDAFISVADVTTSPGGGKSSPEPTSLVLAATAVLGLTVRRFTRSRRREA